MAEEGEEEMSFNFRRKRSKIITKTDSTQEANKDTQLVKMFCLDLGPYYILKDKGFQEFIENNIPNYTLPSMKKFSEELIPELYNRAKADLTKTLESVDHVAISIDSWKWPDTERRNARNMWTATIHYVQQGKLVSQNLFTMEANFRAEKNIVNALNKASRNWGVLKKVVCFITNNGKNDKLLEKAVTDSFKVPHVFCTAAKINCVIEEALKDFKFKEFVSKYYKDNSDSQKSKKKDHPFSWHYWYTMLKDISENNAGNFNEDERKIHRECVKMLKPFEDFNNTLSSQQYLTLSYIFPLIADVRSTISKCPTLTGPAAEVKKTLLEKLDENFKNYESYPTTAKAIFMDPRFKNDYFTPEKAESVQLDIINEFNECVNSIHNQQNPDPSTSRNQSEENGNVLGASTGVDVTSHVRVQVNDYVTQSTLDRSEDPFKFWESINDFYKKKPVNFYIMSQKYLCIPATATPVEMISGEFLWKINEPNDINYNERRSSLEFKNIDKMLFLHSYYRNK